MDGTALDDAIRKRHADIVQHLVATRHACIPANESYTLRFIKAAADNDVAMVDMLIAAGADPNRCGRDHRTALHACVATGAIDVARQLVNVPHIRLGPMDRLGHTPLWDAVVLRNREMAQVLYEAGAPLQDGCATFVCQAAAENRSGFIEGLLELDISLHMRVSHLCISSAAINVILLYNLLLHGGIGSRTNTHRKAIGHGITFRRSKNLRS
jgi:hypothetical protein